MPHGTLLHVQVVSLLSIKILTVFNLLIFKCLGITCCKDFLYCLVHCSNCEFRSRSVQRWRSVHFLLSILFRKAISRVPFHNGKACSEHVHTDGLQYRGSCKCTTTVTAESWYRVILQPVNGIAGVWTLHYKEALSYKMLRSATSGLESAVVKLDFLV